MSFTGVMKFLKYALDFFAFITKVDESNVAPKRAIRDKRLGIK